MTLIDRYIEAVADRLPEKLKADVKLELRSNILDMLPDDPEEADIRRVLEGMGSPSELALQYSPTKQYLIGPAVYDRYIEVLKLVLGIVAATFTVLISLDWMFKDSGGEDLAGNVAGYISGTIGGVLEGMLQAAFWVTIIFVFLERKHVLDGQSFFNAKPWRIEDLPSPVVSKKSRISRGKTIAGICVTIFLTFLLLTRPGVISIITHDSSGTIVTPIFDIDRFSAYGFFILAAALLSLVLSIWKLLTERWTFPIAVGNTLFNVLICVLIVIMANDSALWNEAVPSAISGIFSKDDADNLITWSKNGVYMFLIMVIGISIWDSADGFLRSRGSRR